jgi:hypothetical protein
MARPAVGWSVTPESLVRGRGSPAVKGLVDCRHNPTHAPGRPGQNIGFPAEESRFWRAPPLPDLPGNPGGLVALAKLVN